MKFQRKVVVAILSLIGLVVVATVMATNYTVHTPIGDVSLTIPDNGDIIFIGDSIDCECTLPTDEDCSDAGGEWHVVSDSVAVTWSGPGTFDPTTGTSVTWTTPSAAGEVTITSTADDSPLADDNSKSDSVTLTVLDVNKVEVHKTSSYTDNGGDGLNDCQVHFGYRAGSTYGYSDVYIEVHMKGGKSGTVDQFTLTVTSESDATGINVAFTETGANTNIYHCDNPIHLSTSSNQGNLELRVDDEEHISVGGVDGPEVDRGEVATITADVGAWLQDYADGGADEIDRLFDYWDGIVEYAWWECGEPREITNATFPNFIKNVGNSNPPADFLFECSHGNLGNFGDDTIYKPGSGPTPTVDSSDWEQDIEWAIFYSCHVLGQHRCSQPAQWVGYWDNALLRGANENNAHGIMASCDYLWAPPTEDHMELFEAQIEGDADTIRDSYMETAIDDSLGQWEQWNASALFHSANTGDKVDDVTQDTSNCQMSYTWYAAEHDPCDQDANVWSAGAPQFTPVVESGYEVLCVLPTDRPQLTKVAVRKQIPGEADLNITGFGKVKLDNLGRVQLRKSCEDNPILLSRAQACAKANSFISAKGGGMPADAELAVVRTQKVATYDAMDLENTWTEYVKKGFFEYRRKINGIKVIGDRILVGVGKDGVVDFKRHWRKTVGPTGSLQKVIAAKDALDVAVKNIPTVIPNADTYGYSITKIELVYFGLPSEAMDQSLTPAWGFQINATMWAYVDAFTGEFLK